MEKRTMHKIKEMVCKEMDDIARKDKLSMSDLEIVDKLSNTEKNLMKIEMLEGSSQRGYSRDGGSYGGSYGGGSYDGGSYGNSYRGSYGDYSGFNEDGQSEARMGSHYVGGHYSMAADTEMDRKMEEKLHDPHLSQEAKDIIRKAREYMHR